MKKRFCAVLLILPLLLLSACDSEPPEESQCPYVPRQTTVEVPDDENGDYVTVSMMLPVLEPMEFEEENNFRLFSIGEDVDPILLFYDDQSFVYCNSTHSVYGYAMEEGIPVEPGTEFTVDIPFTKTITFYTTEERLYPNGMKASATFHYKDGRTVYESFDGLEMGTIKLDSHGRIVADEFVYAFEGNPNWSADVVAQYRGIGDDSLQTVEATMPSLTYEFWVLDDGMLAADCSESDSYTRTITKPDGTETQTQHSGGELWEYEWGYEDSDYAILSAAFFNDMEISNDCGEVLYGYSGHEESKPENPMPVYHSYFPGAELGPVYSQLDVDSHNYFTCTYTGKWRSWLAVTNMSPEQGNSLLYVDGSFTTAELHKNGTTVLSGNLSECNVYFMPPGEEHLLCLRGSADQDGDMQVFYSHGTLVAKGEGVKYTVTEEDASVLPFDPEDRPVIIGRGFPNWEE